MKKKLLSLKSALDWSLKDLRLTWENVHHLGKNNIRIIVKDLRKGLSTPRKLANEILHTYKLFPKGTAEYKERKLLENFIACAISHRKEVIAELNKIAMKSSNMPLLPQFEKEIDFGEAIYTFDFQKACWVEGFYFNVYSNRHMLELHISLASLRLLQKQKKNKPFLALWKKQRPKSYDLRGLLSIVLPTEEELLQKRITVATINMKSPEYSEVMDNLVELIEHDKKRLDTLKK